LSRGNFAKFLLRLEKSIFIGFLSDIVNQISYREENKQEIFIPSIIIVTSYSRHNYEKNDEDNISNYVEIALVFLFLHVLPPKI